MYYILIKFFVVDVWRFALNKLSDPKWATSRKAEIRVIALLRRKRPSCTGFNIKVKSSQCLRSWNNGMMRLFELSHCEILIALRLSQLPVFAIHILSCIAWFLCEARTCRIERDPSPPTAETLYLLRSISEGRCQLLRIVHLKHMPSQTSSLATTVHFLEC